MTNEVYFSLNDSSLSYGKKKIFEKISFSLHHNDKVALIGKNGVGKSSLLKIIAGNLGLDSGDLWVSNRIKIGFLSQSLSNKSDLWWRKCWTYGNNRKNINKFKKRSNWDYT